MLDFKQHQVEIYVVGEKGGSEGMNGEKHIPLKGVSGEERSRAYLYLSPVCPSLLPTLHCSSCPSSVLQDQLNLIRLFALQR